LVKSLPNFQRRPRAGGDPYAVTIVWREAKVAFNREFGGYGSPLSRGRQRVMVS